MNEELVRWTTGVLSILMLSGIIAFIVLYVSRANWKATPVGRHLLYFMVALAAVLVIRFFRSFWPEVVWLMWVQVATFASLVAVVWQRVFLLVRSLRASEEEDINGRS